ncbi:MAG: fatty acid desaturase [Deltaproteobacteria bacterium]|nr:fatty acid desaturase [Deltaproteobacteria bacterium]
MAIALLFVGHWYSSIFFQSFFLHRYGAHRMFYMSRFWERVFYFLTFISIGPSFFNPRAYAVMHRRHHAYSDQEGDPHSPKFFSNILSLLWGTIKFYLKTELKRAEPKDAFERNCPEWDSFDKLTNRWSVRIIFAGLYVLFYYYFAAAWWMYFLLSVHLMMGGVVGTLVNWFGHRYGYVNFDETNDSSKNCFPIDLLLLGELLQNNHHKFPGRPNFAVTAFEVDPLYPIIVLFNWLGIVRFSRSADGQTGSSVESLGRRSLPKGTR